MRVSDLTLGDFVLKLFLCGECELMVVIPVTLFSDVLSVNRSPNRRLARENTGGRCLLMTR